ncbi:sodium/hydrogen exchanger [Paenibacillus curdlanolyticus YK9]|uniref:Sodium/hydrogen exchanger n=1 Tax=Paenibacillus curdlanolyticus YK9 TaxID=717606 RepID=E0I6D0_9BACL|nr:cation:proton antiporter [Paenibacillus curdlanolyticus]EFM11596.1 sodium/hydrogen exchanger [Paenibacillus curdlanolyticus YK9]
MNLQPSFLFLVLASIVVVLICCRVVGKLFSMVGQPQVIGEMVAGIILGPLLFGSLFPGFMTHLYTPEVKSVLYAISNIGLTIYMFLIGLELDTKNLNRGQLARSGILASSGLVLPFILGVVTALYLYQTVLTTDSSLLTVSLFFGVAFSVTAFPVLSRILEEKGLLRTKMGSLVLMAASFDDALAWCLLAIVTSLATAKSAYGGLGSLGLCLCLVLVLFFVVRPILKRLDRSADHKLTTGLFAVVIILLLATGAAADYIGVHSVFGAFLLGLSIPRTAAYMKLEEKLKELVNILFVPIFFAYAGMSMNIKNISMGMLIAFSLIFFMAVLGKYGGCSFTMRRMGFSWREASAAGGLMNAKGTMGLIIANIGFTYGIIDQSMYSLFVLLAVITSVMAVVIYNLSIKEKGDSYYLFSKRVG